MNTARSGPTRVGLRYWLSLVAAALLAQGVNVAFAQSHVSFTLNGCRLALNTNSPLENYGFVCSDNAYTPGNLQNWNELDLVPHRVTATAGGAAPDSQTYTFKVEADNCKNYEADVPYECADGQSGHPGYDQISIPVLNTELSSATGCSLDSVSDPVGVDTSGANGVVTSLNRELTVTQSKGTTCVFDYYQRLALGAHLFSGSALHSNVEYGGGQKEVSLPVNDVLPQELDKDMTATQNGEVTWNLAKTGSTNDVSFGDVCAAEPTTEQPASVTITWTKNATTYGKVAITTNVYAHNPSARSITVNITDQIYKGLTQTTLLHTMVFDPIVVGPGETSPAQTHSVELDAADAGSIGNSLNDVATATYTDTVTELPIPGFITASASTTIQQGSVSSAQATIADSESITGDGLTFSVATPPALGSFLNAYDGSATVGPVDWDSGLQSASGDITFSKTIYLDGQLVTTGTLHDEASLITSDQIVPGSSPASFDINIASSATVSLTVSKSIPADYLANYLNQTGDTLTTRFEITASGGYSSTVELTFANGDPDLLKSQTLTGLAPNDYTVTEKTGAYCSASEALAHECTEFCDGSANCTTTTFLAPDENPRVAFLSVPASGDMAGRCSDTTAFVNQPTQEGVRASVKKVTDPVLTNVDPDYEWTFTLSGPNVSTCLPAVADAGADFVVFKAANGTDDCLLSDGDYSVTETLKAGWIEDSATPHDTDPLVCAFSVNLITDDGETFSCTFHNTKLGHANVVKTVSGGTPNTTDSFEFQLREGATASPPDDGTILQVRYADNTNGFAPNFATELVPGNDYQFCEVVMPGWSSSLTQDPNYFIPSDGGLFEAVCVPFTVGAGETKTFTVDNSPPPGGLARTIGFWKNWSSCKRSKGNQDPVLDDTLLLAGAGGIPVGSYLTLVYDQCDETVNLLNKSTMSSGIKKASDALFRLAAQLIAAELNVVAGAGACTDATTAISQANTLLSKYHFNGNSYSGTLSKADQTTANQLEGILDSYNNNTLCQ